MKSLKNKNALYGGSVSIKLLCIVCFGFFPHEMEIILRTTVIHFEELIRSCFQESAGSEATSKHNSILWSQFA